MVIYYYINQVPTIISTYMYITYTGNTSIHVIMVIGGGYIQIYYLNCLWQLIIIYKLIHSCRHSHILSSNNEFIQVLTFENFKYLHKYNIILKIIFF